MKIVCTARTYHVDHQVYVQGRELVLPRDAAKPLLDSGHFAVLEHDPESAEVPFEAGTAGQLDSLTWLLDGMPYRGQLAAGVVPGVVRDEPLAGTGEGEQVGGGLLPRGDERDLPVATEGGEQKPAKRQRRRR